MLSFKPTITPANFPCVFNFIFSSTKDYGRSNPLTKKKAFEEWFLE